MPKQTFLENFFQVMPSIAVIGSQWGDEGKGKLIDILSESADFVIRYQGGANAGHTLEVGDKKIVVHLIPSSVFHPQATGIIGNGVVLDLEGLCQEIKELKSHNLLSRTQSLLISDTATLLLDTHKELDQAREESQTHKIGTTKKGIGPAYESRASRKALLFRDLFEEDQVLLEKLKQQVKESHFLLENLYHKKALSVSALFEKIKTYRDILRPHRLPQLSLFLNQALKDNKKLLFEGAQGTLLDLYHGTYPFVTSSSTLSGAILSSCGLGLSHEIKTVAVLKAYSTRVGDGPFITECSEKSPEGKHLQEKGGEFGATTGRKRRCGWLDLPALKYAIQLNGAKKIALMKLDVLSGLDEIKLAVGYHNSEKEQPNKREEDPTNPKQKLQPIYKSFQGWKEDITAIKDKKQLPVQAQKYLDFISEFTGLAIDIVSVGPARSQTFFNSNPELLWTKESD